MASRLTPARPDEYAWANYLIYMEAGGEMPWPPEPARKQPVWPGVALAATASAVAYAAVASSVLPRGLEPVTVALPLGILIGNVGKLPDSLRTGVRYVVKSLLAAGIILLGARLNFDDVLRVGVSALALSAAQVGLMLILAQGMRRAFRLGGKQATLLGIGTAICGGSAIIAAAPVIEAEDRDVAFSVAIVAFLGLGTMFLLPPIGQWLGMAPQAFGVWAGLAIHQTPQVVAAGFAFHPEAGQAATLVKLARVSLLAPLVLALGFFYRRSHPDAKFRQRLRASDFLQPIVAGFLLLAVANSLGWIPSVTFRFPQGAALGIDLLAALNAASGFLIAMGMAAVGMETSLRSLRTIGPSAALVGLVLTLVSVAFSYSAVRWWL